MKIDIERTYKVKMIPALSDDDDAPGAVQEMFVTADMFSDVNKLNETKKEYSIGFIFDKNNLKEVRIKTQYIDYKQKEIDEIQTMDEKTIQNKIYKHFKNPEDKKKILLIYLKENKQTKTVTTIKKDLGLWKWRFDSFCSSLFEKDLKGQPDEVYQAIKEFLFGRKNPTKAKF